MRGENKECYGDECLRVPRTQGSQPYIKGAFKFTNTVKNQGYLN